jgi:hypothetical protein
MRVSVSGFAWRKKDNGFTLSVGPFVANVMPKGDGRWTWEVFADNATGSQATGVGSSTGAAKNAVEQYVKRSGRV